MRRFLYYGNGTTWQVPNIGRRKKHDYPDVVTMLHYRYKLPHQANSG
jgi:hypothetical protein